MLRKSKWAQTAIVAASLMLILNPATSSPRRHGQAAVRMKQELPVDPVPSYDDPSKLGDAGQAANMQPANPAPDVHVQPHGRSFDPDSMSAMEVRRRTNDLDEMLRLEDQELDRKLVICRRC
jgi:hypothetical protein